MDEKWSPCGYADLLAVIVGKDKDEVRTQLGLPPAGTRFYCLNCGKPTRYTHFCSTECRHTYSLIPVVCNNCGLVFYRRSSEVISYDDKSHRRQHFFCNRKCFYSWLGKNYGFAVYPEHSRTAKKYDYDKI